MKVDASKQNQSLVNARGDDAWQEGVVRWVVEQEVVVHGSNTDPKAARPGTWAT